MFQGQTIAAIATAMSNAGIGVIRVSGDQAVEICDKIFKGKIRLSQAETHTVHYGHIIYEDEIIDEVMVLVLRAPKTYTREDIVEIDCHGGMLVLKKILSCIYASGARPAEPGEFTKRAFLNGRIDLSQAESVMDLISSKNEFALSNSMKQLKGEVSSFVKKFREEILYEIAFIESALDDPEHYSLEDYGENLLIKLKKWMKDLTHLLKTCDDGVILKEGIRTVIVGKPNAGKSSLLNALAKKERAIVTDIAGTTRDTLEEQIMFEGISLNIIDTAGIRKTDDTVEKIGVEKALEAVEEADLILYVVDSSISIDENDLNIMDHIKDKKVIVLLNKTDLNQVISEHDLQYKLEPYFNGEILSISAKKFEGIERLEKCIRKLFLSGEFEKREDLYITNVRHKHALQMACQSLENVETSVINKMPEDFYSIDLMEAYEQLGYIIGESLEDDLVNEIFQKFCMGK